MGKRKKNGWLAEVKDARDQIAESKEASKEEAVKAREQEFQEREKAAEELDKEATELAAELETTLTEVNEELFSSLDSDSPVVYNSAKDPNAIFHFLDWSKSTNYDIPYSSKNIAYEVFLLGIPIRDLFNDKRLKFEYISFYYMIFADFKEPSDLILRSTWRGHRQGDKRIYISEIRTLKPNEDAFKKALSTDLQRLFRGQIEFCYVQYKHVQGINMLSRAYGGKASGLKVGSETV